MAEFPKVGMYDEHFMAEYDLDVEHSADVLATTNVQTLGIIQTNDQYIQRIKQAGADVDVTSARIEHLKAFLVKLGVITDEQALMEAHAWAKHLQRQVKPVHDQVMEFVRQQGGDVQQESGLIIPGHGKKV